MTQELLNKAMDLVAEMHVKSSPIKGGKKYTKVVHRVEAFRKVFGLEYAIQTSVKKFSGGVMVTAAIVPNESPAAVGMGHAWASNLAKEKSLEKLETTAIGRALASIGLGGDEYASDTEIETFEERYNDIKAEAKEILIKNAKITTIDKSGNPAVDKAWKDAFDHITNTVDEESCLKVSRHHYKLLKDSGASIEQLASLTDHKDNTITYLRNQNAVREKE